MTKRKLKKKHHKRKHNKSTNKRFKLLNALLAIILALIILMIYVLFTYDNNELKKEPTTVQNIQKTIEKKINEVENKSKKEINKYVEDIEIKKDQFEEYTKDVYEEYIDKDIIELAKKKIKENDKEEILTLNKLDKKKEESKKDIIEDKITTKKINEHKVLPVLTNKPKLAIVIDDVTTQHQINKIHSIGYRTNIAVMPPTPNHKNSAKIAQNLPFYMIHFPMEATSFRGEEENTLRIIDSYERIEKRVAQIRQWYPNAKYTNNHTGSKFTANETAMNHLFKALKKHDFIFMDSRTTGKTVGKKMAKKYDMPYIVRNVFLDNEQKFDYIQNQLKKAIKIAKKNGHAIAIGHPHSITIKVLKESKHLLKDLELIYVNQLPYL